MIIGSNSCTIFLDHGDPLGVAATKQRTRKYLVASDLSDESLYAIEWSQFVQMSMELLVDISSTAIGTVLRDGDTCIIVSVMETESKRSFVSLYFGFE
jgi:hypothetical protein